DMDRPVERLSAGERRRAALARVETERVPLLLLDEPFADLDDAGVNRLRQAITRARDDGRAIVVATHAHRELDGFARAQIALDDGGAAASLSIASRLSRLVSRVPNAGKLTASFARPPSSQFVSSF